MPKKVTEFDPAAALDGTEIVPVIQGGTQTRTTAGDIAALAPGGVGIGDSIASRAALAAVAVPAVGDKRFNVEVHHEGAFIFDDSDLSALVTADTAEGVYVAPASDPTGASGAWVRKRDPDYLMPEWFGAPTDDVSDCTAAFVAMRTLCIALRTDAAFVIRTAPTIILSRRVYNLASSFDWKGCTNIWRGQGSGANQFPSGSIIKMASGQTFYLDTDTAEGGTVGTAISNLGCNGTQFHDIAFEGPGKGVGTAPVMWMRARCDLYNCSFTKAGGHGLQIHATAGGGTTTEGNANLWKMYGGACEDNGDSGLSTEGADTNAGIASGVSFANNGVYGVREHSFLGNKYVGCHWSNNPSGHVNCAGATNQSYFDNYYEIDGSAGTFGPGGFGAGVGAYALAGASIGAYDATGAGVSVFKANGGVGSTITGGGKVSTSLFDYRSDYPGWVYSHTDFSYSPRWGARVGTGLWVWELSMGNTLWLMGLNGASGIRYNFGWSAPPAGVLGISAFALGYEGFFNPDGRIIGYASAAPASIEHALGEFRFNDRSVSGGSLLGWSTTVAGTPGTQTPYYCLTAAPAAIATSGSGADLTAGSVTYAKIQNVSATSRFLGRITAGAGSAEELTGTQAATLIDAATTLLKGLMSAQDKTRLDASFTRYHSLLDCSSFLTAADAAATYAMTQGQKCAVSGTGTQFPVNSIYIAAADYPAAGTLAAKLRIRVVLHCNDVAPGVTFTIGLHPITRPATSGGAGLVIYTVGAAVASSTVAIATPAADSSNVAVTAADFALPADGHYVVGVVTSGGALAASSHVHISTILQMRYA